MRTILFLFLPFMVFGQIVPDTFAVYKSPTVNIIMDQSGSVSGGVVYASSDVRFNWQNIEDGDYGYLYVNHRTPNNGFSYPASVIAQGLPSQDVNSWDELRWYYNEGVIKVFVRPYDYFDISKVPDIVLMLDPSQGTFNDAGVTPAVDGGTVYQWNDQSGSGNNAVQDTAARRPILRAKSLNGHAGVEFDGSDDRMAIVDSDDFDAENGLSFFYVGDPNANGRIFQKGAFSNPESTMYAYPGNGLRVSTVYGFPVTLTTHLLATQYTGQYEKQYKNGTLKEYSDLSTYSNLYTDTLSNPWFKTISLYEDFESTSDPIVIGARYNASSLNYDGLMHYLILMNRCVSDSERESIEGWLAWRFNIQDSLSISHPHRYHPPRSGYHSYQWDSQIISSDPVDFYLGSPSVIKTGVDTLLFFHDRYSLTGSPYDTTYIYRSTDNGDTWDQISQRPEMYWGTPFFSITGDTLFQIGTTKQFGGIRVEYSVDRGDSWSGGTIRYGGNGVSNPPNYSTSAIPPLYWNGYVYKSIERLNGISAMYKSSDLVNWEFAGDILVDDYYNDLTTSMDRVAPTLLFSQDVGVVFEMIRF
jgi:hypothetical protein